jgi:uncharacterized protein (TIGR02147 family)
MDVYAESDYKQVIRHRVKELATTKKSLNLRRLAERIPIQNTYLSKALNDEKTHLNEEHLFKACQILEFYADEMDFIFLLRSSALATDPTRKSYLTGKINRLRQARQRNASIQDFNTGQISQEMSYLFDPLCVIVNVALFIEDYRQQPRKLCAVTGVSWPKLKQTLTKLRDLNFISLGEDGQTVTRVAQQQIHYGTDHPLMRTHQHLMRDKSSVHLSQVPEEEKHSFMATFSADDETFKKIRQRFQVFLKEAEYLVGEAPSQNTFQMNFDLFKWF